MKGVQHCCAWEHNFVVLRVVAIPGPGSRVGPFLPTIVGIEMYLQLGRRPWCRYRICLVGMSSATSVLKTDVNVLNRRHRYQMI